MRYDYKLCNDYLAKKDYLRLWLHIQDEGDKIIESPAERFMVFYKTFVKWLNNPRLCGNFVAYYIGALRYHKQSNAAIVTKTGIMDARTSGTRAENQTWNPQENYSPRSMQEELLLRFSCA